MPGNLKENIYYSRQLASLLVWHRLDQEIFPPAPRTGSIDILYSNSKIH
jgi:hypothetical protein